MKKVLKNEQNQSEENTKEPEQSSTEDENSDVLPETENSETEEESKEEKIDTENTQANSDEEVEENDKTLEIIEIFYNPSGNEADREYFIIKNLKDEPLDLDGFNLSYNDGSGKSLTGQIDDELAFIRRDSCDIEGIPVQSLTFILGNKNGFIELINSAGEEVDRIDFNSIEFDVDLQQDEAIRKENNIWIKSEPKC